MNSNERRGALLGAALIFSATALLRRLFGCGAPLSVVLIFSVPVLLWRLFGIFHYLIAFEAFLVIKLSSPMVFDKKTTNCKK